MDDLAKEYVSSFFDRNLRLHGDRPEAVRWTAAGQQLRYRSMLDIGPLEGRRLLDFGCGKGDFYQFLKDAGISLQYAGWDISNNLIGFARRKYPGADFRVMDIDRDAVTEDFDYVLLCGVFNLEVQGLDDMIRRTLKKLFGHCRIGLAFNGLSDHNPGKDFELHYASPEGLRDFALQELSPFVAVRGDIIPHDFTLFVYREAQRCRNPGMG